MRENISVMFLWCSKMFWFDQTRYTVKKLSLYGKQGTQIAWFKNYLKDRQQFSYPLLAKHSHHKWSRPVYAKVPHWDHSYFSSSLMIYHSILWMFIAIYLQMTVLYIQWVNQQMKPIGLCKNLLIRLGSGSIVTTFLLTSLKLYVH